MHRKGFGSGSCSARTRRILDPARASKTRIGIPAAQTYRRSMSSWPIETITDQDPRYRELIEQEADARRRFLASPQARAEFAALAQADCPRPDWQPVPVRRRERQRVYRWD